MRDERAQQGLVGGDCEERGLGLMQKLVEFRGREVGEWVHLGVAPDQLDGIEFGGVAGQQVGVDAVTMPRKPSAHRSAAMGGQPVPDEVDGTALVARELLEEVQDGLAVVIGIGAAGRRCCGSGGGAARS